ncbi:MAG: hypothetical protein MI740_18315 [Halanaerobiales bacterium]|nr:hypothetical protein [Halanaerobiales bacterium]
MKPIDIVLIGSTYNEDDVSSIYKVLADAGISAGSIDFTSNVNSSMTTHLIEGASYFSSRFSVKIMQRFEEGKERLKSYLEQGVRYIALCSRYIDNIKQYRQIIRYVKKLNKTVQVIIGGRFFQQILGKLNQRESKALYQFIGADIYIVKYASEPVLKKLLEKGEENLHQYQILFILTKATISQHLLKNRIFP